MNKRQKILIVDDAKFNRDILKEFLGEIYDYLEAEKWKSGSPDYGRESGNRSDAFRHQHAIDGWI